MPATEEEKQRRRAKKDLRSGHNSGATDTQRNEAMYSALTSNGKKKVYDWEKPYVQVHKSVRLQVKGATSKEKTLPPAAQAVSSNKRPRAGENSEVPIDLTEDTVATAPMPPAKRAKLADAATSDATQETGTTEVAAFATNDGLMPSTKTTKANQRAPKKPRAPPKAAEDKVTKPAARKPRAPTKTSTAKATARVAKSMAPTKASPADATQTAEPKTNSSGPAQAAAAAAAAAASVAAPQQQQPTPPASFRSKSLVPATQTAESKNNASAPPPPPAQAPAAAEPTPPASRSHSPAKKQQQQLGERITNWVGAVENASASEKVVENAATPEEVAEFRRKLFADESDNDEPEEEKEIVYGELMIHWGGVDPDARRGGHAVASNPQEAIDYRERLEAEAKDKVREWDHDSLFDGSEEEEEVEEAKVEEEAKVDEVADEEESDDDSGDEEDEEEEEKEDAAGDLGAALEAEIEAGIVEAFREGEEEEEVEDDTDEVESVESEEE